MENREKYIDVNPIILIITLSVMFNILISIFK